MSSALISVLKAKKQNYIDKIEAAGEKLAKLEDAYESLLEFKSTVSSSQESFHDINSSKSSILSEVKTVRKNCLTASEYYSGMKNIFTGTGTKIIGAVYSTLIKTISAKLKKYKNSIEDYEEKIAGYKKKLAEIEAQLSAALLEEAAAK